jgi:predicted ATPase
MAVDTMKLLEQLDESSRNTVTWLTGSSSELSGGRPRDNHKLPLNLENVSLVGRSHEIQQLLEAYERIRKENAPAEVFLIRGEAGTGKSALVDFLERTEKKGKEYFCSGKFGQLDQNRPYGAFVDATTELGFSIQQQTAESFQETRDRILETLQADELQLLASVMPTIELLHVPVPVPRQQKQQDNININEQSFNRFMEIYRKFLQCICRQEHPIVLFLDDLQWADDVSRQLIHSIVQDDNMRNMLLLGTIREDHANIQSSAFDLTADAVLQCSEMTLGGLTQNNVNQIVAKATGRQPSDTADLSAIVFRKTGGNAYFVLQYIEMLHRDEFLTFHFGNGRFEWKANEIIAALTDVSENVVQVLVRKIESLTVDVHVVLLVAACLGYKFPVRVMECVLASEDLGPAIPSFLLKTTADVVSIPMSGSDTEIALTKAIQAGLLEKLPGNNKSCKFSHDRVQQSAYSMLPHGEEGQRFKAALGKILLEMSQQSAFLEDWMLFAAVDLLSNHSNSTPTAGDTNNGEFAKLCLQAAQKASQKAAFRSAAKYADLGIRQLTEDDVHQRSSSYDLWLELSNVSVKMHYCRGEFEESKKVFESILQNSRRLEDNFHGYNVLMDIFASLQDWTGAVTHGCRLLEELGVPAPKNPSILNILHILRKIKRSLNGRKANDLEGLPSSDNPRMAQALLLLGKTAFCAWCGGKFDLCSILCLKMMLVTLEHGIMTDSSYAFAAYGMCRSQLGDYAGAHEYGALAVKVANRPGMEKEIAKVYTVVHTYLSFLKLPIQESLEPLLSGYTSGMQTGDLTQAAFCLRARSAMGFFAGIHFEEHERYVVFCSLTAL